MGLGPFDEVGDDQEVARIVHAVNDVDLEGETLLIILIRGARRQAVHAEAPREPLFGLTLQLRRLLGGGIRSRSGADGEARQDRLSRLRPERAALGNLDRGRQRFRDVGEQHRHLGAGLEAVIGGELVAIGLGDQPPAGNAQQRVVGLVIVIAREIRLVGCDQRQAFPVGEIDQPGLATTLLVDAMALQFDIEPVAEQARQSFCAISSQRRMISAERERDRPIRPAGQRDHVLGLALEPVELDVRRLVGRRLQKRPRVQPHQAAIAALARRQQHDPRRPRRKRAACIGIDVAEIDRELAADDRLDAVARHLVGEFQRPEHVVGVGERQGRLAVRFRELAELCNLDRTLQQRIGRMNVEMNESGAGHGRFGVSGSWRGAIVRAWGSSSRPDSPCNGGGSDAQSPCSTDNPRQPSGFSPGGPLPTACTGAPRPPRLRVGGSVAPTPRSSR